jgi:hypothetical protein
MPRFAVAFISLRWLWPFLVAVLVAGCVSDSGSSGPVSMTVEEPGNRLVYQRGLDNAAFVPVSGVCAATRGTVEARLLDPKDRTSKSGWMKVARVGSDGRFQGRLRTTAGWYALDLRVRGGGKTLAAATVDRVGVGEVFIVVGHSVAQGGDINLPGATDDRVNTVDLGPANSERQRDYERTADPKYLPAAVGTQFATGVRPAPFGHGTYFWAKFAENVARNQNVPVLLLNAGFGGTSLQHWAKAARGEQFEHSFVKSGIRMPYINLQNAITKYASKTGVRAILADQGQNDAGEPDADIIFANYRTWVEQIRRDSSWPHLAVVVNRQTPYPDRNPIYRAQVRVLRDVPSTFQGPDYDTMAEADRYDRIHLSEAGERTAARLWEQALDAGFFRTAAPGLPRQ